MGDTVNDFLLPLVGYRSRTSGVLSYQGEAAYYRTSTPNSAHIYNLRFDTNLLYPQAAHYRTYGFSVRCFKNPVPKPLEGEITYSTTTATNQDVVATLTLNRAGTVLES
jgi:hypothetical protein